MRIVHAVADENGGAGGGIPGDQTGGEIRETEWYAREGGWAQYIECADGPLADAAAELARAIAKGNYGYSQSARWTGYDSVRKNGAGNGCGDFDCSSLVLSCYRLAGLGIGERKGSTRDIAKRLCDTGRFRLYTDAAHVASPALAKKGSLYCAPGKHVVICVGGPGSGARSAVEGESPAGDGADKDGSGPKLRPDGAGSRLTVRGSVRIRETPVTGRTVAIAHAGDILPVAGRDEKTGWYRVPGGYVTDGERYVTHV